MTGESRIRRDVPIPYYYQLMRLLENDIQTGKWGPEDLLPSEHELCGIYGVSRTVVRQALGGLVSAGLLQRVKGKGTFVSPQKLEEKFVQRSDGFYREMSSRGLVVTSKVLDQQVISAPPHVTQRLELEDGDPVIKIDRLRSVEGQVLLFVQTYIPQRFCPDLVGDDVSQGSLYALLREKYGLSIATGRRLVEAVPAHPPVTKLLNVSRGAPVLKIESVSYLARGQPLEYYEAWHRGDRSRFEIEMVVEPAVAAPLPLAALQPAGVA